MFISLHKRLRDHVRYARFSRVDLQGKTALAVSVLVLCLTTIGGFLHFKLTKSSLVAHDRFQATSLVKALSLPAEEAIRQGQPRQLQGLVEEVMKNPNVKGVALLDAEGKLIAVAGGSSSPRWKELLSMPPALADTLPSSDGLMLLARPIVMTSSGGHRLVGSVRLAMDTSNTDKLLANVRTNLALVAAVLTVGSLLLGQLLIWRLVTGPMIKLTAVANRLRKGDYAARTGIEGSDEIAQLSRSLDTMADEIEKSHIELLMANQQLEAKVAQRTIALESVNERLRQEMADKEEFLRAVSHDLNAPLQNIGGMAMMILRHHDKALPADAVSRLQRIQANVEHQSSLINELLELSRVRSRPERKQLVDMGLIMEDLGRIFEYQLRERNINFDVERGLPCLFVEKLRIRQIFQNLIDNAIKYMDKPVEAWIKISYQSTDSMHRFIVADNGPGVHEDQRQMIFQVFRRCENSQTAKVPGKGVGLSLVRAVVSNYEGRAYVETTPGGGSSFVIELDKKRTVMESEVPSEQVVVTA